MYQSSPPSLIHQSSANVKTAVVNSKRCRCIENRIGELLRNNGTRGQVSGGCDCRKIAPRLGAKIWSGHSKRGSGVLILPPYGSLNSEARHPGVTETHNFGNCIRNH
jgi:hypothetical protein